jgi:lytic murein transglycosylase
MRPTLTATLLAAFALPAAAQTGAVPCGGDWAAFLEGIRAEAVAQGVPDGSARAFLAGARQDGRVLARDRDQGHLQQDFVTFSRRLISQDRVDRADVMSRRHDATFAAIEAELGVPRGVLLAFWAFETDFGQIQGDFDTTDALLTLAHDCRRPELFRPQVIAAMELHARGQWDTGVTGAWAGEIGQVQMLPRDILAYGTDGDGDGRVDLKGSAPDALWSAARMLRGLGWRPGEPWLQEVSVPADLDWSLTGLGRDRPAADWAARGVVARQGSLPALPASLVLPMGRKGPAFLAYPNLPLLTEWNQSLTYVLTAAYFATRIEGAPRYEAGNPDPALSREELVALQQRLAARGHDVGAIDGILGARTREAVQAEQARLGQPADAWPTRDLLDRL